MAHGGDWRAAGVDAQAEQLNNPLVGAMVSGAGTGRIASGWQAVDIRSSGAAHMEIAALKPAEQAGGVALRLVEVRGGGGVVTIRWGFPVGAVCATDLFEQPVEIDGFAHDAATGTTRCAVRPFQIVTLRAEIAMIGADA
jgi:alpha-mannosidase